MIEPMLMLNRIIWVIHQRFHSLNPQVSELILRYKLPILPNRIFQFAINVWRPKNIHHSAEVAGSAH